MRLTCCLFTVVCSIALWAPEARACDWAPGAGATTPGDMQALPRGSAIFVHGADLTADDAVVTIDGEAAAVKVIPELTGPRPFGDLALMVVPEPPEGSVVALSGTFCPPEYSCPQLEASFIVVEPDTQPPVATDNVWLNVLEHPHGYQSSCDDSGGDVTYYLTFNDGPGSTDPVRDVTHIVARRANTDVVVGEHVVTADDEDGPRTVALTYEKAQVLGGTAAPEALCFELRALDASLHAADPVEVCLPCYHRATDDPQALWEPPQWTDDDVYENGVCAVVGTTGGPVGSTGEVSTTGETDGTDTDSDSGGALSGRGGCACSTRGERHGPAPWLLLLLTPVLRRRREPADGKTGLDAR